MVITDSYSGKHQRAPEGAKVVDWSAEAQQLLEENIRLKQERNDCQQNWNALCYALVGNTGLSAITEAKRLRALHPLSHTE